MYCEDLKSRRLPDVSYVLQNEQYTVYLGVASLTVFLYPSPNPHHLPFRGHGWLWKSFLLSGSSNTEWMCSVVSNCRWCSMLQWKELLLTEYLLAGTVQTALYAASLILITTQWSGCSPFYWWEENRLWWFRHFAWGHTIVTCTAGIQTTPTSTQHTLMDLVKMQIRIQ